MNIYKKTLFPLALLLTAMPIFASAEKSPTIYESSINWLDEAAKIKLLEHTPVWHNDAINTMFTVYHKNSQAINPHISNIQFINSYWGPLNNPFVKYSRPAKVFIFYEENTKKFLMAPLIKNSSDNNFYVFDNSQNKPILLNEWVTLRMQNHSTPNSIRINICQGYGNYPTDSCTEKRYQDEARDTYNEKYLKASIAVNAHRNFNESWKTKLNNFKYIKNAAVKSPNIYNKSKDWADQTGKQKLYDKIVSWPNYKTIQTNFEKIRDLRYYTDPDFPNLSRRITWLYPDDGCWSRASAVIKDLFGPIDNPFSSYKRPSKVFVFGDLCALTPNSPKGAVSWWYHTAPIIKDAETKQDYVLDPSVDPNKPMTLDAWISAISSHQGRCTSLNSNIETINICNGYGSDPFDICKSEFQAEIKGMIYQPGFLDVERERQVDLERNADEVLGDLPPWITKN